MNAESKNDKDYMDYARDAQVLRARYLSNLMADGWRRMKRFILSYRRRIAGNPRLTHNS